MQVQGKIIRGQWKKQLVKNKIKTNTEMKINKQQPGCVTNLCSAFEGKKAT